jgi:3-oxoacyl-[acyl-carrier-protein] synthase-3
MGTRIEAVATAHRRGRMFGRGMRHLSDTAAAACLEHARHSPDELDLLINTGIYKDHNTAEPALASIIQEDIGANPGNPPRFGHHGTFSFDLLDGGCGVITAARLLDGFVGRGGARLGLIVAGDVDPSPRTSRGFRFTPAGGAMLIGHADGDTGFVRFASRTFPEHAELFEAKLVWDEARKRNVLEIAEAPELAATSATCAATVVRELLGGEGLDPGELDLVIASPYPRGFGPRVVHALGIPVDRLPHVPLALSGAHTTGPIAALEAAIESGAFARAKHVLFVAAGAGITIGAALYRA